MKTHYLAASIAALVILPHCTFERTEVSDASTSAPSSSSSGPSSSGAGGQGSGASTGTETSTTASSTGVGGSPPGVQSCADLCALAPVDPATGLCVAGYITGAGYNTDIPECDEIASNTPSGCLTCYDALAVEDEHCVEAHLACF